MERSINAEYKLAWMLSFLGSVSAAGFLLEISFLRTETKPGESDSHRFLDLVLRCLHRSSHIEIASRGKIRSPRFWGEPGPEPQKQKIISKELLEFSVRFSGIYSISNTREMTRARKNFYIYTFLSNRRHLMYPTSFTNPDASKIAGEN